MRFRLLISSILTISVAVGASALAADKRKAPPGPVDPVAVRFPQLPAQSTVDLGPPVPPGPIEARLAIYGGSDYDLSPTCDIGDIKPEVATAIAKQLAKTDFIPAGRIQNFAWCDRADLMVQGWQGLIESIKRTPRGLMVQVEIRPKLARNGCMAILVMDAYTEHYLFDRNGKFIFVDGARSKTARSQSFIPL
jgi:hypothetical protein